MSNFGSVGSIHCATIIAVDSHTSTFIRAKFAARFDDKRESPPPRERERESSERKRKSKLQNSFCSEIWLKPFKNPFEKHYWKFFCQSLTTSPYLTQRTLMYFARGIAFSGSLTALGNMATSVIDRRTFTIKSEVSTWVQLAKTSSDVSSSNSRVKLLLILMLKC